MELRSSAFPLYHPRMSRLADRTLWVSRMALGLAWSGVLVLIAMACFDRAPAWAPAMVSRMAGVCCFAAGQFVLMVMVLDGVCPRASRAVTGTLELAAAMVFWGGGAVCLYLVTAT
jgi:hypothetical protein